MAVVNYSTRVEDGTKTAPGYSFRQDTDTGIYRIGANNLGISVADTKIVDVGTTGATVTGEVAATTVVVGPATVATPIQTWQNTSGNTLVSISDGVNGPLDAEPTIYGFPIDDHNVFYIISAVLAADDDEASENAPAMIIDGRRTNGTALVNRDILGIANVGTYLVATFRKNGALYIQDGAATIPLNTFMTLGITLNQGAADNEIFAGKSSDVAHGMTAVAETDTFVTVQKAAAIAGGAMLTGLMDGSAGTGANAVVLRGLVGETVDTAKSTTGGGAISFVAARNSGTGIADVGANGNLAVIKNNATTRFIFDAEGSAHGDVEWAVF